MAEPSPDLEVEQVKYANIKGKITRDRSWG